MNTLWLDYETFSHENIKNGTYAYAKHPTTEALLAGYARNYDPVKLWDAASIEPMPEDLKAALEDPDCIIIAWNAPFEMAITRYVLGYDIPNHRWRDAMVQAYYCAMPGKLEDVAKIVGTSVPKMTEGRRLIKKFCTPRKPTKKDPSTRVMPWDSEADWALFCQYCMTDVNVMREVMARLEPFAMPDSEWQMWFLDQKINQAGFPINRKFVANADRLSRVEQARLLKIMAEETGLANANSGPQLLGWLRERGYPYKTLAKDAVAKYLDQDQGTDDVKSILLLRQDSSKTSVKKYPTILRATCDDDRLRGTLQFGGASRTLRWAGRITQFQNLPRPVKWLESQIDAASRIVESSNQLSDVHLYYPDVMPVLTSLIRSSIQAHPGKILNVADLASIETRVLGWLAGCKGILDVYAAGLDAYKVFASLMYHKPYDEVTKAERNIAKPAVLACMAPETLVLTARGWKAIIDVQTHDLLWDGVEWVSHDGVIYQGEKEVVDFFGVRVTPDHKLLTEEETWSQVGDCLKSPSLSQSVLNRGRSGLQVMYGADAAGASSTYASAPAEWRQDRQGTILTPVAQRPATSVAESKGTRRLKNTRASSQIAPCEPCGRTGTQRYYPAATIQTTRLTATTALAGYFSRTAGTIKQLSLETFSSLKAGITPLWNWIESITIKVMNPATYVWQPARSSAVTPACAIGLSTTAASTRRWSSGKDSPPRTSARPLSPEKPAQVNPLKKSSQTSRTAGALTSVYDILNCGPRSRFMVLTEEGPSIASNCGYAMGAKGLKAYAEAMFVEMSLEESEHAKKTYRDAYWEVPIFWDKLKAAIWYVIETARPTSVGCLRFDAKGPFLRIQLPSGRHLHYYKPRVETIEAPWSTAERYAEVDAFTYMGLNQTTRKWERVNAHMGGVCENLCQGVARDVLVNGLKAADAEGLEIVGHVHDEIISHDPLTDTAALHTLLDCMTRVPAWAKGLPLDAAGYSSFIYKKD